MSIFPPSGYDPRYWPQDGSDPKWTRWFAWYPVMIDVYKPEEIKNGKMRYRVWWRDVECRQTPDYDESEGPPYGYSRPMQFRLPQ
jgi:hypothetical protein